MPIAKHHLVNRKPELVWTPVDSDAVILADNHYISLDAIGRRIWELLEQPIGVQQLCDALSGEFQAPPGQIEADVQAFLHELRSEGLIRVSECAAG